MTLSPTFAKQDRESVCRQLCLALYTNNQRAASPCRENVSVSTETVMITTLFLMCGCKKNIKIFTWCLKNTNYNSLFV